MEFINQYITTIKKNTYKETAEKVYKDYCKLYQ